MDIFKHKIGTNVEYFLKDGYKVFWIFVDTVKPDDVRMWAMNLGTYEIVEETEESSFLDIWLLTGLSDVLIIDLARDLEPGFVVSFVKGNIHQKQSVFPPILPKDLVN